MGPKHVTGDQIGCRALQTDARKRRLWFVDAGLFGGIFGR
jgi:hypothetical protein